MQLLLKGVISLSALISLIGLICLGFSAPSLMTFNAVLGVCIFGALSFVMPQVAISVFLFLLPVFGNKPGTSQAYYLLLLGMSLQLGCTLSIFKTTYAKINFKKEVLAPALWYVLISILSLFPVSAIIFWGWFKSSQSSFWDLSLLNWNFTSILLAREDEATYPLLSVFWTILSFCLTYFVCIFCQQQPKNRFRFCWALLSGFLVSLVVGLLNYYGQLDLLTLRQLDPVVNPGGTQYRLQSWFGHSGWFAEYITMLAPFCMLVLTLGIAFWKRVSIILFLLLVGEIDLILTFQRGGWLSYPLSLLAIWASIYVLRKLEAGNSNIPAAFKASAIKILISLPLTLLVSFLIIKSFGSQFGLDQYKDRFKDIAKASDRTEFIKAGFELGALNPIFGLGSESFALQYKREFKEKDGAYSEQIDLPLHGTAHNLYAQTFEGKGILGLLGLFFIMLYSIRRAFLYVFDIKTQTLHSDRIVALACACSIIAVLIYGFVQELFYVQSLQYVFFAVVGIIASLPLEKKNSFRISNRRIAILLGALFCVHLLYWGSTSRKYLDTFGCHPLETGQDGKSWRWCGLRSNIDLPLTDLKEKALVLEVAPPTSKSQQKQKLRIEACNQVIFSNEVSPSERVTLKILPEQLNCQALKPGYLRVNASLGSYFIPAKENSASGDRRVLALRWIF